MLIIINGGDTIDKLILEIEVESDKGSGNNTCEGIIGFSTEKLNNLMENKNITAYKLAKITNIPISHMYRIRDGVVVDPQISTIIKIAKCLEVSIFDLMKA